MGEAEQLTCALLGRWQELQVLASEPPERHLLFAGDADDAANGLYSTLSDPVCTASAPGDPAGHTSVPMLQLGHGTEWGREGSVRKRTGELGGVALRGNLLLVPKQDGMLSKYLQAAES